ncbi:hypothetical protein BD408DRAFT_430650 [Parasitella parasitica]|nr:hypothetical protein BD408DRAFT_430650 [Parasitella parasitica]
MSDVLTLMEDFIKAERYPSLVKFCAAHEDPIKAYISHFENAVAAKKNLQVKMKLAFNNVRGKKKRGPGVEINLESSYAEAKAVDAITIAGWESLATSVQQAKEKLISNQRTEGHEHNNTDVESASSTQEEIVDTSSEQSYDEQDDSSILQQFYKYKKATEVSAKKRGFYVDGNLHEILCLSDVLFLKENEYSDEQISHFGATNLDRLRSTLITKYMDSKVKFDTNLYNQVSEILRDFRSQDGTRKTKEKLSELLKEACDDDYKLIEIIINW